MSVNLAKGVYLCSTVLTCRVSVIRIVNSSYNMSIREVMALILYWKYIFLQYRIYTEWPWESATITKEKLIISRYYVNVYKIPPIIQKKH